MPSTTEITYVFPAGDITGTSSETILKTRVIPTSTPEEIRIESVGYTIMAASIQSSLGTDSFILKLDDGGTVQTETITFSKALPSMEELVAIFNQAIINAFAAFPEAPPVMVEKDGVFVIRSVSVITEATFTFNEASAILWFSDETFAPTLVVPGGTESELFLPSPRLGAQFQKLAVAGGGTSGVKLPLTGSFMTPIIYFPVDGAHTGIGGLGQTARVITQYPAIDRTVEERPLTRTHFVLSIRE